DREERDAARRQEREAAFREQALRRDIDEVEFAGPDLRLDGLGPGRAELAVEAGRPHAHGGKRIDLVLHQRDQGRDDHADAIAQQRGDLVAQRLAPAGRHEDERVAAPADMFDDCRLLAAEPGVAEDRAQPVERERAVVSGRAHAAAAPRAGRGLMAGWGGRALRRARVGGTTARGARGSGGGTGTSATTRRGPAVAAGGARAGAVLVTEADASLREVVGRELHRHLVTRED